MGYFIIRQQLDKLKLQERSLWSTNFVALVANPTAYTKPQWLSAHPLVVAAGVIAISTGLVA
jgi:hypothetical protein